MTRSLAKTTLLASFLAALAAPSIAAAADDCPRGMRDEAGICYEPCKKGFKGVGIICYEHCQGGYADDGLFCRRNAHNVDANRSACPWYDACCLTLAKGKSKCPGGYLNHGCTCHRPAHIYAKKTYTRRSSAIDIGAKIKRGFESAMMGLVDKLKDAVWPLVEPELHKVIEESAGRVGFNEADAERILDPTGRVSDSVLKDVVVEKLINMHVRPIMNGLVMQLIEKGLELISTALEGVSSAVVGAIGSIPFAGGVLAAIANMGFKLGLTVLKKFAATKLTELIMTRVIDPIAKKGIGWLLGRGGIVKAAVEKLFTKARSFFGRWIVRPAAKVATATPPPTSGKKVFRQTLSSTGATRTDAVLRILDKARKELAAVLDGGRFFVIARNTVARRPVARLELLGWDSRPFAVTVVAGALAVNGKKVPSIRFLGWNGDKMSATLE